MVFCTIGGVRTDVSIFRCLLLFFLYLGLVPPPPGVFSSRVPETGRTQKPMCRLEVDPLSVCLIATFASSILDSADSALMTVCLSKASVNNPDYQGAVTQPAQDTC